MWDTGTPALTGCLACDGLAHGVRPEAVSAAWRPVTTLVIFKLL